MSGVVADPSLWMGDESVAKSCTLCVAFHPEDPKGVSVSRDPAGHACLAVATVCMQCDPSPEVNLERMAEMIRGIKQDHPSVRLVFFGETILGWFYRGDETQSYHERIAETIPGPATGVIADLAAAHGVYVSFGMTERGDGVLHNAQVLIDPNGEILAVHRKVKIRNPVFEPGDRPLTTASIDGFTVATAICADFRHPQVLRQIRRARPDIVLASLADYATGLLLPRMMGSLFDAWTLVANRYGEEPPILWHGLITATDRMARLRDQHVGSPHVLVRTIPRRGEGPFPVRWLRRGMVGTKLLGLILWAGLRLGVDTLRNACRFPTKQQSS